MPCLSRKNLSRRLETFCTPFRSPTSTALEEEFVTYLIPASLQDNLLISLFGMYFTAKSTHLRSSLYQIVAHNHASCNESREGTLVMLTGQIVYR